LDEVSVFRGVLKPSQFSVQKDYPSPYGNPTATFAASGFYQSLPHDWAVPVKLTELTLAVELNGGQVTATVEVSNDGFRTVASATQLDVQGGVRTYPLNSLACWAQAVRVRFDLSRGPNAASTPVVDGFRITAQPARKR
jgi:hypothetical protein